MKAGFVSLGLAPRLARTEAAIGDRLPYARHLDDATIETRDGMLLQVIKIAGFPFETADDQELNYRKQVRESLLKALASSRLTLYHHVVRRRFTPGFGRLPEDAFSLSLEEGWRETLAARRLFVNDLYLTLVLRPALGRSRWLDSLTRGRGQDAAAQATALRQLTMLRNNLMATLAPYGPHCLTRYRDVRGEASEPCAFLAQLVNGELRRMITPGGDIGQALADRRLTFGLDAMEISAAGALPRQFAAMVSIKDYPARSTPGLLDGVLRLPCELVMTESFTFADRQVSLGRMGLALRRLRAADDDAYSLREELAAARDEVGAGLHLVGNESFKGGHLLLGFTMTARELMHRTSREKHTRHIRVRGHQGGEGIRNNHRGVVREAFGLPRGAPNSVFVLLWQIREGFVFRKLPSLEAIAPLLNGILDAGFQPPPDESLDLRIKRASDHYWSSIPS
jgi:type IV secretion system protein VirB4